MGYLRRPAYYKNFRCISSACTDSCCSDWEIDIDPDTLCYYQSVEGDFGEELKKKIYVPDEDEDAVAHFIQTKSERCPFLNENNLCEIFIHLGEEHLSQICTHHPRFYDWFFEGEEAGLGLCCEEACGLILSADGMASLECLEGEDEEEDLTDMEFEILLEKEVFSMRDTLFAIAEKKEADSFHQLFFDIDLLYSEGLRFHDKLDEMMFPGDPFEADDEGGFSFTEHFFTEESLVKLLSFYEKLEINDLSWWKLLKDLKKEVPQLLSKKADFLLFYQDRLTEYRNLLIYFIYRHFMKAREDTQVSGRLAFILNSLFMIMLVDIHEWMKKGSLSLWDQINICKLYSKEIEYSEDNVEALIEAGIL